MITRDRARTLWSGWIIAGCVFEAVAFAKGESGSTLSSYVWDRCHIDRRQPFSEQVRRGVTIGFIVWLPIHWISGGKV